MPRESAHGPPCVPLALPDSVSQRGTCGTAAMHMLRAIQWWVRKNPPQILWELLILQRGNIGSSSILPRVADCKFPGLPRFAGLGSLLLLLFLILLDKFLFNTSHHGLFCYAPFSLNSRVQGPSKEIDTRHVFLFTALSHSTDECWKLMAEHKQKQIE